MDGRPDDVAGRGDVASDHGPDLAGREHEPGVIERALGGLGGLLIRPALGLALLEEQVDVFALGGVGQGVDDRDAGDVDPVVLGDLVDGLGRSDQAGLGNVLFPQYQGGLEGPDVLGVGESDLEELLGGLVPDVGNERVAHGVLLMILPKKR